MCAFFFAATLGCCSDSRKSIGPSAPIAYATSVSPPNEAVAWPGARVLGAGYGCRLYWAEGVGWQMILLVVLGAVPANHRARFKNVIYS